MPVFAVGIPPVAVGDGAERMPSRGASVDGRTGIRYLNENR